MLYYTFNTPHEVQIATGQKPGENSHQNKVKSRHLPMRARERDFLLSLAGTQHDALWETRLSGGLTNQKDIVH